MTVKNKVTGKVYDYPDRNYCFRSIRFYQPGMFEEFSRECRKKGTNANLEINKAVEFALSKKTLLSELLVK